MLKLLTVSKCSYVAFLSLINVLECKERMVLNAVIRAVERMHSFFLLQFLKTTLLFGE